jgi:hypothetical protein
MIPIDVFRGMWVAALAQAEFCDVLVQEARVELSARYEPSTDLENTFLGHHHDLVGVLGWAVPHERGVQARRPPWSAVQWRTRGFGIRGPTGAN